MARDDTTVVSLPAGAQLRITSRSGRVTVTGEARGDVLVEGRTARVSTSPDGVEVDVASGAVTVRCPTGTDVLVGAASGAVELRGVLGDARVTTESGGITVEEVTRLDARSRSGSIRVERCAGDCRARADSGRVSITQAGSVEVAAASGNVEADAVGDASIRAGSGKVTVGLTRPGDVAIEVHSGSVDVTLPAGVCPACDLASHSGRVNREFEPGDDGSIRVRTGSGTVTVRNRG